MKVSRKRLEKILRIYDEVMICPDCPAKKFCKEKFLPSFDTDCSEVVIAWLNEDSENED